MRVAFLATYDPTDASQWSGIARSMVHALKATGAEVVLAAPLRGSVLDRSAAAFMALLPRAVGRRYLRDRHVPLLRSIAAEARRMIQHIRPDVVFSPGTLPLAYLDCDVPITFWTDATFSGVVDFYPEFSRLVGRSRHVGKLVEQQALNRAAAAFYSSAWAARSAVADYGLSPSRVCVAPFGPNIPPPANTAEAYHVIEARSSIICRLVFIATDWQRKGGPRALEIARGVAAAGIPVELLLVGKVPSAVTLPPYARVIGWIDKRDDSAVARLCAVLRESHFLVFPTQADTTPVSLIEAASYGVPALAADVGGISEVVRHNVTGTLFPSWARSTDYVEFIADTWARRDRYVEMGAAAYQEYATRLNWTAGGMIVRQRIDQLVNGVTA